MKGLQFLRDRFKRTGRGRFERVNTVFLILLAGWVPSVILLVLAQTTLKQTLESKILRDRQTFVQLMAHLVDEDLARTSAIIEYYQTLPDVAKILGAQNAELFAQTWLAQAFFAHPRIDGMFICSADGRLLAALPSNPALVGQDYNSELWREGARTTEGAYVSPVHPRLVDKRLTTDLIGAVRTTDGTVVGYLGISVLIERIGRRLSTIELAEQANCQVLDQMGAPLFSTNLQPHSGDVSQAWKDLTREIRAKRSGHFERNGNLYSFGPLETAGWMTVVEQPRNVAYQAVDDLVGKLTYPAGWLILLTAVGGWLAEKFYRRQTEAARRIEREVIFNEKILANMPSGIALVDPVTCRFSLANEAFAQMARRFGGLPRNKKITEATYRDVKIAPEDAIEKVLSSGTPYQAIEEPLTDAGGVQRFVNVNLLRLQGSQQTIQGVLYLVEDKTRDVTLRQELIGANAAKDQFLALLSHELRNPLSPVIAMVGELEASAPDTPEMRHALEVIRRNVELEARLIDDLLDVTRIAKGKLQLTTEVVSVHEVLRRAYEICREEILAKKLGVEFRLRAERSHVDGDPARLQQVFWNLIKNSVKFTPEHGRIIIETFNPSANEIEIRTTDTGIGIEQDKIDKIFNAFEQGQSSITRRFGGLGLGLAISKAMVDAHGGRISVESAGKDKGTTFKVSLQTVSAPQAAEKKKEPASPAGSTKRDGPAHKPRVLVVDDHHDTCLGMKMMLERRGYDITLAHSADQAVTKAREKDFDLLISDIGLPDRSGYELMRELREMRGMRGIALSGFGMENDVSDAHAAGFSEHLTKPINFDRLQEAIQSILELAPADGA